jgi:glycolate oxidase iron-sulfur subunit
VRYGRLVDIGRRVVDERVPREPADRLKRAVLKEVLPRAWVFRPAYRTGQALRPLLPRTLREKVVPHVAAPALPARSHARKMLLLDGCVQPAMAPNINAASTRVLDALGVELLVAPRAGCCGALRYHLNDQAAGLDDMRRNIDAWWPYVEQVEAILMTASGCGVTVKEYGHLLRHDPRYAEKAERISAMTRDLSEVLPEFESQVAQLVAGRVRERVAYHPPCTLQHGQEIRGKVEGLLRAAGVDVVLCADAHLCCGSAGTYSVLHPELAHELRDRKVANLEATGAGAVVSANIGCITHLQSGTGLPVTHWIEMIDRAIAGG